MKYIFRKELLYKYITHNKLTTRPNGWEIAIDGQEAVYNERIGNLCVYTSTDNYYLVVEAWCEEVDV